MKHPGTSLRMKPRSTSLFSLLFFLLLPFPSLFYSLRNCTVDFYDESVIVCDFNKLTTVPSDVPTSATSLSLFDNWIVRINHRDFSGLSRLVFLHLGTNLISHIDDGAFVDLSALTELMLPFNQLQHLTDDMFKGLSRLVNLYLFKNKIEFISKLAFEPLKNLQELHLSFNNLVQISDIVPVLQQCPSLKIVDLQQNQFRSFESDELPFPLVNVTQFDLNSKSLKKFSIHSDVFPDLKSLDFSSTDPEFEWDVSNKMFLKSVRSLFFVWPKISVDTCRLILQSVDSIEKLYLTGFGKLFDKDLLDSTCAITSLQILRIDDNDIFILNDTLLQSCSNLTELTLSSNSLRHLTERSLRSQTRLKTLTFKDNLLSEVPLAVRNISTLTFLSFESNQIKELQCLDFLNLSALTELNLKSNHISKLSSCVFKDLQSLKIINIENNYLIEIDGFGDSFPNLSVLEADRNNVGWLQKGTFYNLSSLTDLSLNSARATRVDDAAFEGLFHLKTLSLSTSEYFYRFNTFAGLPRLEKLVIFLFNDESVSRLTKSDVSVDLPSLQELTVIINRDICFSWTRYFLEGLGNLQVLSLDKYCCNTPTSDLLYFIPRLLSLQFINCDKFSPDPELFQPVTELEVLNLTDNNIRSLDFLVGANLTKLERLNLGNNQLSVINENVFEALPSLKYLDLSGNPFACNCSNAGFIHWATTNKRVQVVNAFQFRCSSPFSHDGRFLMSFEVQSCWEFVGFFCFISTSASVLFTLLSSFIYHFLRWQLAYGYYLFLAFLYDNKKQKEGGAHVYDAFVSYNVNDEDWVYGELLPELEEQQGWRLCLHHRDFQPGKPIIENITDAIYSSRKTLCVISRRYLQSEWCSREIQMASFRLLDEQKDVLILLFLEDIPSHQLSPFYRMRKLVKSRTYLSWTQARTQSGVFWEKVRRALETGNQPDDHPLTLTLAANN